MFNVTSYMPAPTHNDVVADTLAEEVQAELRRLQFDVPCDEDENYVVSFMPAYGFSAVLLYLPRLLSYSVSTGKSVVLTGHVAGAEVANKYFI
jgi:hypothetical protein